mgnify:CR=1 FL=1
MDPPFASRLHASMGHGSSISRQCRRVARGRAVREARLDGGEVVLADRLPPVVVERVEPHGRDGQDALAGRCFGDNTGAWAPRYSSLDDPHLYGNVTSAQQDPAAYTSSCSSRADCSYNGACTAGVCECYPQWMGKYCGQLNLVATDAEDATMMLT